MTFDSNREKKTTCIEILSDIATAWKTCKPNKTESEHKLILIPPFRSKLSQIVAICVDVEIL